MKFDLSRRALVAGAAAMLPTMAFGQAKQPAPGTSVLTGRVYGPDAPPINYPDPDILITSPEGAKCFIGHSNIKRVGTGMVWAEGPAWSNQGQYVVWSDVTDDLQYRYIWETGEITPFRVDVGLVKIADLLRCSGLSGGVLPSLFDDFLDLILNHLVENRESSITRFIRWNLRPLQPATIDMLVEILARSDRPIEILQQDSGGLFRPHQAVTPENARQAAASHQSQAVPHPASPYLHLFLQASIE